MYFVTLSPSFPTQTNVIVDSVDKVDTKQAGEEKGEKGCQSPKCCCGKKTPPSEGFQVQLEGSSLKDNGFLNIRTPAGSFWKCKKTLLMVIGMGRANLALRDKSQGC